MARRSPDKSEPEEKQKSVKKTTKSKSKVKRVSSRSKKTEPPGIESTANPIPLVVPPPGIDDPGREPKYHVLIQNCTDATVFAYRRSGSIAWAETLKEIPHNCEGPCQSLDTGGELAFSVDCETEEFVVDFRLRDADNSTWLVLEKGILPQCPPLATRGKLCIENSDLVVDPTP